MPIGRRGADISVAAAAVANCRPGPLPKACRRNSTPNFNRRKTAVKARSRKPTAQYTKPAREILRRMLSAASPLPKVRDRTPNAKKKLPPKSSWPLKIHPEAHYKKRNNRTLNAEKKTLPKPATERSPPKTCQSPAAIAHRQKFNAERPTPKPATQNPAGL